VPDWRTAYLEQAFSDFTILQKLIQDGAPLCHQLHYFQMTTEKMAKGFLTPPGGPRYPKVHDAFVKFINVSKSRPEFRRASPFADSQQFARYVESLRHKAKEVEDLSPEGGDHPNPEYPWEVGGTIYTPLAYPFSSLDFGKNPQMMKLLKFVEDCLEIRDH